MTSWGKAWAPAGSVAPIGLAVPEFRLSRRWDATRFEITPKDTLSAGLPVRFGVVPSIDAPISRLQAKIFDVKLEEFQGTVLGAQISSDLPNTINRFLQQEDILRLDGLSDTTTRTSAARSACSSRSHGFSPGPCS